MNDRKKNRPRGRPRVSGVCKLSKAVTVKFSKIDYERLCRRSRQRKLSLDEYRKAFLQVPRIEDRKPVFVSGEVRDRLDEFVRRLGGRKMSVSGLLENIARQHLEIYSEDFEQWRKL